MIREPYSVFPYNTTIDTALEKEFSYTFNGDQLRFYDYQILENNNRKNIFKDFDTLKSIDAPGNIAYNDTILSLDILDNPKMKNKNLIWRLRLVENLGNWEGANIPSMQMQNGRIEESPDGQSNKFKGIITGQLETVGEKDLQEGFVSIRTDAMSPETYRVTKYESYYYEYYTLGQGGYYVEGSKNPDEKAILYCIDEHLTLFDSHELDRFNAGEILNYPVIKDKPSITRAYFQLSDSITYYNPEDKKKEHPLTSSTLFTKEEVDACIEDKDYAIYTIAPLLGSPTKPTGTNFYLYKNFYDTNFYYFQSRPKPTITFVDENDQDFKIDISKNSYTLDGRYAMFKVKERDSINTKYFKWELYRNDKHNPIVSTNKIFSQDIKFSYDNFLNDYSYKILLYLETQDDASYVYEIPNIVVDYDENIRMQTEAFVTYNKESSCVEIVWPTQKVSEPTIIGDKSNIVLDSRWKDEAGVISVAKKILPSGNDTQNGIKYTTLIGDKLRIDPEHFIFSTSFYINEKFFRNYPDTFVLARLQSEDESTWLEVIKDGMSLKILTSDTPKGAQFYKRDTYPAEENFFNFLTINPNFMFKEKYSALTARYDYYKLPDGENVSLQDDSYELYEADTELRVFRYRLLVSREGAYLLRYRSSDPYDPIDPDKDFLHWELDGEYVIDNNDPDNNFKIKNSYFNEVRLNSQIESAANQYCSYRYLTIYNIGSIEKLLLKYEPNFYDFYKAPYWDTCPEQKLICVDYARQLKSAYDLDVDGEIKGYRIYRFEYGNGEGAMSAVKIRAFAKRYKALATSCKSLRELQQELKAINPKVAYLANLETQDRATNIPILNHYLKEFPAIKNIIIEYHKTWKVSEKLEWMSYELSLDFPMIARDVNLSGGGVEANLRYFESEAIRQERQRVLLDQTLIGEFDGSQLTKINNNNDFLIRDFAAHNRGYFEYQITPRVIEEGNTTKVLGKAMITPMIYTDDYHWTLTSIGKRKDGSYAPVEQWQLYLDLKSGDYEHNVNKVFHTGFGKYPKISVGTTDYITTSLSCYVGKFQYNHNLKYNGELRVGGTLTRPTTPEKLCRLYVEQTPALEDFNFQKDGAYITLKGQERKIVNYGMDYIDYRPYYFIDIYYEFLNFIPGMAYSDYIISIVKDKNNPNNYTELGQLNSYRDDIEIVNSWNKFAASNELILVKDLKGNCFIGAISENSENYNRDIDQLPTTINFTLTQIDDVKNYRILG